jgi:hypothetical protein
MQAIQAENPENVSASLNTKQIEQRMTLNAPVITWHITITTHRGTPTPPALH